MPASVAVDGELVAVFDADFIPQHRFLERCIGFLQEPDVALLQSPQSVPERRSGDAQSGGWNVAAAG